jgi:tetratricopeptide (TPR) repeat protein
VTTNDDSAASLVSKLEKLLASDASSEDLSRLLFTSTVDQVRRRDPELAHLLVVCAIPRRFDVPVLRALLDEQDNDRTRLDEFMRNLGSFGFVRARSDGRLIYHDTVRDMVVRDWLADSDRHEEFVTLNKRLADYWDQEYQWGAQLQSDLLRARSVLQKANPVRLGSIAGLVQARLIAPMMEVIYHETLRSPEDGHRAFTQYFKKYEGEQKFSICKSLVNAFRQSLNELPNTVADPMLRWVQYWEARVRQNLEQSNQSEVILKQLLDDGLDDDVKLKYWVLGELGRALHAGYRLAEARHVYEQELALAEETHVDDFNLPTTYSRLATVLEVLSELDKAAELYQRAANLAGEQDNKVTEIYALVSLSRVEHALGRNAVALDRMLHCFDMLKMMQGYGQLLTLHVLVAHRLTALLASLRPREARTLFKESEYLLTESEPTAGPNLGFEYMDALRKSNRLIPAELLAQNLRHELERNRSSRLATEWIFKLAGLDRARGRYAQAIEGCQEVVERVASGKGDAWDEAAALALRGECHTLTGEVAAARLCLDAAMAAWSNIGNKVAAAFIGVKLSDLHRSQGRFEEAHRLLDEAGELLLGGHLGDVARWHLVRAQTYENQGRRPEALAQYEKVSAIGQRLGDHQIVGKSQLALASIAAQGGDWIGSAAYSRTATRMWERLAQLDELVPTTSEEQADDENARGVMVSLGEGEDRAGRIKEARRLFQSAATLAPLNVLYSVNQAYAAGELQRWEEATDLLGGALLRGRDVLRSTAFRERLAYFVASHAEALESSGDVAGARHVQARAAQRYSDLLPGEIDSH